MKVVVVDADISYPTTSGKRLRTLNLMLRLADRHDITYLGRLTGDATDDPAARAFLRDHRIEPIFVHAPLPRKAGLGFYPRLAVNLLSSWPYSVQSHQSAPMRDAIRRLAAERDVEVWQLEWQGYLPMVERQPRAPRVVMAHNVDSLIWQRYYETAGNPLKRAFLHNQWRKFEAFERGAFAEAERLVAVSAEDAGLMRTRFGAERVDVVDNGVDPEFFAQVSGPRQARTILFLGALDWRPNQDGVDLLLERIFPEVRREVADARLLVVGRNPPARLRERVAASAGVELHADVADVRPFLARAEVLAVPLRIGGGSRLKILEALAANLPVVASRVGAEGLHLTPDVHFVQADEDVMATALVQALRNPEPLRRMAERGQALVREQYDWSVLARKLERSWETARAQKGNPEAALAAGVG